MNLHHLYTVCVCVCVKFILVISKLDNIQQHSTDRFSINSVIEVVLSEHYLFCSLG